METIGLYRLDERAKLPVRSTEGSVGYDLFTIEDVKIAPGEETKLRTGWALSNGLPMRLDIGVGMELQVRPRSSTFAKYRILIPNSPGTIDPDYAHEIMILAYNAGAEVAEIPAGSRVAQLVVNFVALPQLVESDYQVQKPQEQGHEGFGSTGT